MLLAAACGTPPPGDRGDASTDARSVDGDARIDGAIVDAGPACRVVDLPALAPRNVLATRGATTTRVSLVAAVPSLTGSPVLPAQLTLVFTVANDVASTVELACPTSAWCANGRTLEYVFNGGEHYDPYGLEAGSITVAALADTPVNNELAATTTALRFRRTRASATPVGEEFVPGGDCVELRAATIAVAAPVGLACLEQRDCATGDVCAATTLRCAHPECTVDADCGVGRACEAVGAATTTRTCFPTCTPFAGATPCGADATCRRRGDSSSVGLCVATGPTRGPLGATCLLSDVATSCAVGLACVPDGAAASCRTTCDHHATAPGCPTGLRCLPADVCAPPPPLVDLAALDAPCAIVDAPCADDGRRYRGTCRRELQSPNLPVALVCRAICLPGVTTCAFGQCQPGVGRPSACSLW